MHHSRRFQTFPAPFESNILLNSLFAYGELKNKQCFFIYIIRCNYWTLHSDCVYLYRVAVSFMYLETVPEHFDRKVCAFRKKRQARDGVGFNLGHM